MKQKVNRNKKAVALRYDRSEPAPAVVASGKGYVAGKILESAEQANIPILKDEALVEELGLLDLGESIPPELYQAVAQILVFVMELDKSKDRPYAQ